MKNAFVAILLAAVLLVVPIVASAMTSAECHDLMRKLWTDEAFWMRSYMISALFGLPDREAAAQRLMQNQTDIGNAIKSFYGDDAGNRLTGLLKEHVTIAMELIDADKAGDKAKNDDAMDRWEANGDKIVDFLSSANPNSWPHGDMEAMFRKHLELMGAEIDLILVKDWPLEVIYYDFMNGVAIEMADALSAGLVAQFPDEFARED